MLAPHVWALAKIVVAGHVGGAARVAVHVPAKVTAGEKQRAALAQERLVVLWGVGDWIMFNKNCTFCTVTVRQPFVEG